MLACEDAPAITVYSSVTVKYCLPSNAVAFSGALVSTRKYVPGRSLPFLMYVPPGPALISDTFTDEASAPKIFFAIRTPSSVPLSA